MKEAENQSRPDSQPGPHRLDYESRNLSSAKRRWNVWGIVSFSSMVLWFPCMACGVNIAWGMEPVAGAGGSPRLGGCILMTAYYLPLFVGLACGLCSIKFAGIALRNILGVIGFISSVAVLLVTAYQICLR